VRGLRRDAAGSKGAEPVSEAHALFPRFSQERCAVMVHAPGLLYTGVAAYFVWADPPKSVGLPKGTYKARTMSCLLRSSQLPRG
jgi:hypothetical protein